MASPIEEIITGRNTWRINMTAYNIIGKGGCGIVYKSTHETHGDIAAKSIPVTKLRLLSKDVERLLQLKHENIVQIVDIHQTDEMLWMIMEFCPLGDLNKFFNHTNLKLESKLHLMVHIARGVAYLHMQNVIHRDIKPANILVADRLVKLTDFDVTKILDPEIETSVMSSDVGINAFKSPEFFQKNKQGKIKYHRNVDTIAAALTFLAMIQYENGSGKKLIPHIETPMHDSELYHAIGSLLAERIKYKIDELSVVHLNDNQECEEDPENAKVICEIKKLIAKMTHVQPGERMSAAEALQMLEGLLQGTNKVSS